MKTFLFWSSLDLLVPFISIKPRPKKVFALPKGKKLKFPFFGRFLIFQKDDLCKSKMFASPSLAVVKFNFQKNKNFFLKSHNRYSGSHLFLSCSVPVADHYYRIQPDSNVQLIEQEFFIGTLPI